MLACAQLDSSTLIQVRLGLPTLVNLRQTVYRRAHRPTSLRRSSHGILGWVKLTIKIKHDDPHSVRFPNPTGLLTWISLLAASVLHCVPEVCSALKVCLQVPFTKEIILWLLLPFRERFPLMTFRVWSILRLIVAIVWGHLIPLIPSAFDLKSVWFFFYTWV